MTQDEQDPPAQTPTLSDKATSGDEPDSQPDTGKVEAPPADRPRSALGLILAVLALLIALAAAGGSGFLWWQQQGQRDINASIGQMRSDILDQSTDVARVTERVAGLSSVRDEIAADLTKLEDRLDRQAQALDELPLRLGRLERALDNIPGVADKARSAWLLAEAEYYLRVANAQLALANSPDVALRALELADEKLRDVGDPGLTQVRAKLADEITAVKALPRPDTVGIVLELGSIADNLSELQLSRDTPVRYSSDAGEATGAGLERAWDAVRNALFSIVRVKRADDTITPLVSDEAEFLLRQSLAVDLQTARLAMMRGEADLYRSALDSADTRLRQYFDVSSARGRAIVESIEKLRVAELPGDRPDISGSLTLLLKLSNEIAGR